MNPSIRQAVAERISAATQQPSEIVAVRPASGGCINQAFTIELADRRQFFVKLNDSAAEDMFACEAAGLEALSATGTIRVPQVIGWGNHGNASFLILQAIATGKPTKEFSARFGRQLAETHQATIGTRFGFDSDNYLGSTPQPNSWTDRWVEFWRERRLGFQLKLARANGVADSTLNRLGDRLLNRLDRWIDMPEEPPVLIHGDLWSGNYLIDADDRPVLIDPAAYYGQREAEFGMIALFGGFDDRFHRAYHQAWPLPEGHADRVEFYKLYHLLNHLNLFGSSYMAGCISILKRFA